MGTVRMNAAAEFIELIPIESILPAGVTVAKAMADGQTVQYLLVGDRFPDGGLHEPIPLVDLIFEQVEVAGLAHGQVLASFHGVESYGKWDVTEAYNAGREKNVRNQISATAKDV